MVSSKTQVSRFYVDALTTTPVLLNNAREGVDYILMRLKTESATIAIRDIVIMTTDDLTEVDLPGAQAIFYGIVPDTVFNRKQVEKNNSADWTYDLLFADVAEIDVMFPITAIICSVEIAATQALTFNSPLTVTTAGHFALAAAGEDYAARSLAIVGSGTGTQIIAAVLHGIGTIID